MGKSERRGRVDVEFELWKNRPEPAKDFLRQLTSDVRGRHQAGPGSLRLTIALAGTLALLISLASVGGLEYAAAGPKSAIQAVGRVVTESNDKVRVVNASPASHQYDPKCNSGRGNLSETEEGETRSTDSTTLINPHEPNHGGLGPGDSPTGDCDPGNSGSHNSGGD